MRIPIIIIGTALVALLTFAVLMGTKSPNCERMYNEYTNTTNVQMQQALMNEGVANGCFHAN